MDYLAITSIQIWQSQRLRLLESHLYVMPNFYCLWVSTLSLGEEKSGNQHLLDTGNSYNVRGFLFLPRFEMKTMGNREVANYVSSTKRDSMCWWECFKWTFSHSSPHPPWLISKLFPIICPLPVDKVTGAWRYLNIFLVSLIMIITCCLVRDECDDGANDEEGVNNSKSVNFCHLWCDSDS